MTAIAQLPLPFVRTARAAGPFLWAPSNEAARAFLADCSTWPQGRLALWGEAGSGKTHLLQLWAERQGAACLAGAGLTEVPEPESFAPRGFAIDEADRCPVPTAMLHLLNRCAEAGKPVLLVARTPPARWPVPLADLASRLRAMTAVELAAPEDSLLRALLARLAAERQLVMPEELADWMRLRLPRTAAAMREAVERLDALSLAAGRAPNRALVAAVISGMSKEEEDKEGVLF